MADKPTRPPRRAWVSKWAPRIDDEFPFRSHRAHDRPVTEIFFENETFGRFSANVVTLVLQCWNAFWCALAAGFRISVFYPLFLVPLGLLYPLFRQMRPGETLPTPKPEDRVEYAYWVETRRMFTVAQWIFLTVGCVISGIVCGGAGAGPWEILGRLLFQVALGYALMRIFPAN